MHKFMTLLHGLKDQIASQYEGCSLISLISSNVLTGCIVGAMLMGSGLPVIIDFLLFFLLSYLIITAVQGVISLFAKKNKRKKVRTRIANGICLIAIGVYFGVVCYEKVPLKVICIVAVACYISIQLTILSLYSILVRRQYHILVFLVGALSLSCSCIVIYSLVGEGFEDNHRKEYLSITNDSYQLAMDSSFLFENEIQTGRYTVAELRYGPNEDYQIEKTIDLEPFVSGYSGVTEFLRDKYWGFDMGHVPLEGKVWYPEESDNCPVVFIIHGNHTMTTESYLGYEYIGTHLASRGYVVISVNENVLNYYIDRGLAGENDARAILLLEHIKLMKELNTTENTVLYQRLDYENISIAGHSRGGEAVAIASLFNEMEYFPDNGNVKLEYHFPIESVIAIAPTTDQYLPAAREVMLTDVNYLLIQGSTDQDVSTFMGSKQYQNVQFTGRKSCFKTYLYIDGANHGQFNTKWNMDYPMPFQFLLNQKNLLTGEEQRRVLLGYLTAFLDTTTGKKNCTELFTDYKVFEEQLPETIYVQSYQNSSFTVLANYEEDSNLTSLTIPNGRGYAKGMAFWNEQKEGYQDEISNRDRDNYVLNLVWDDLEAEYTLDLSQVNTSRHYQLQKQSYIQFDIKNNNLQQAKDDNIELMNLEVVVVDDRGQEAAVPMKEYSSVYPALPVRLYKLQLTMDMLDYKSEFQTVRLPIQAFVEANPKLELQKIERIEFKLNQQTGNILLDNIGISN